MKYDIYEIKEMVERFVKDGAESLNQEEALFLRDNLKWFDEEYQKIAWAYLVDEMSTTKIGDHLNLSSGAIAYRLERLGISRRSEAEGTHLAQVQHCKVEPIRDALVGNLLGDGSLISISKYSARFSLDSIHKEYVDYLERIYFRGDFVMTHYTRKEEKQQFPDGEHFCKESYQIKSKTYKELKAERNRWYPNGKRAIPKNIELSPLACLLWYLDDGSTVKGGGLMLYTNSFTVGDVNFLRHLLEGIGIETTLEIDRGYPIIYIKKAFKDDFLLYILPEFPQELEECFGYKFL